MVPIWVAVVIGLGALAFGFLVGAVSILEWMADEGADHAECERSRGYEQGVRDATARFRGDVHAS